MLNGAEEWLREMVVGVADSGWCGGSFDRLGQPTLTVESVCGGKKVY